MAPHHGRFVSYLRVSTQQQGRSGLASRLSARRLRTTSTAAAGSCSPSSLRPRPASAGPAEARGGAGDGRLNNATLVIAKLDRLSATPSSCSTSLRARRRRRCVLRPADHTDRADGQVLHPSDGRGRRAGGKADLAADQGGAGGGEGARQELGTSAEPEERSGTPESNRSISGRAQGQVEARAADLKPVIEELRASGATSLGKLRAGLEREAHPDAAKRGPWTPIQVSRVLSQLEAGR